MYPVCTRPLVCMLLGFESMHLPPNVALFPLEDNQSSAKALEPTGSSLNPALLITYFASTRRVQRCFCTLAVTQVRLRTAELNGGVRTHAIKYV